MRKFGFKKVPKLTDDLRSNVLMAFSENPIL